MATKDKCKQVMAKYIGESSAAQVDAWADQGMSDDEITAKCRAKIAGLIGEAEAKELD